MTNPNYTHITVVLDSSGSMSSILDETIGGFNTFLKAQKEAPGQATLTQIHFSSGRNRSLIGGFITPAVGVPAPVAMPSYGYEPYEVLNDFSDIQSVAELNKESFVPGGMTPLLDSIGRAIVETGQRLAALPEEQRPGKVLFVVLTDGHENASRNFNKDQVLKMIKTQEAVYSWAFMFLGANMDAVAVGSSLGFNAGSSLTFNAHDKVATESTYRMLACKSASLRSAEIGSAAYYSATNFTPDERAVAMGEDVVTANVSNVSV